MIVIMILWVLYSVSEAYEDSQYTVFLDHKPTLYPRIMHGLTCLYLWYGWQGLALVDCLTFGFILASVFWFVFELSGNLFNGHYFYYIGTTSVTDRKLKEYEWPIFWLRIWLVALAFALYYRDLLNIY